MPQDLNYLMLKKLKFSSPELKGPSGRGETVAGKLKTNCAL